MKGHTLFRGRAVIIGLCAIAAAVTACGDPGQDPAPAHATTTTTTRAADRPPLPLPGPGDLNIGLLLALDPDTPREQKIGAVQGADADPDLVDKMTRAGLDSKVAMTITAVEYAGDGIMQASATLSLDGKPVQGQALIPFVAENGRWKLQKAWACRMLANAQLTSTACQ